MRIGIGEFIHQSNTFNPLQGTIEDFRRRGFFEGPEVVARMKGDAIVGGFIDALLEAGHEPVGTLRAASQPAASGRLTAELVDDMEARLRRTLEAAKPLDGLAFATVGTSCAIGENDVSGRLAKVAREVLGPGVPIALAIDHHSNLTPLLVESADVIVAYQTQPHDKPETGRRTMA